MSKLKALAADKSMVERWKIISPGKKGMKTKVTAEEGQPLVADAVARANERARANHPPTQVADTVARVVHRGPVATWSSVLLELCECDGGLQRRVKEAGAVLLPRSNALELVLAAALLATHTQVAVDTAERQPLAGNLLEARL